MVSNLVRNPTDSERHAMTMNALIAEGRPYDYETIVNLLGPSPDIRNYGVPGEFKNIKVGIIGGGLAGLSAAYELRKLGFDITVFEAQKDRIGGRVYTYYFENDKRLYGELGAMRIPASHETTWHYINLFGLSTSPFIQANPNTYTYIAGTRVRNTPANIMEKIYPKYNLTWAERNTPWPVLYNRVSRAALLSIPMNVRPKLLQVLPKYSPEYEQFTVQSERQVMESYGLSYSAMNLITSCMPMVNAVLHNSYAETLIEDFALNFKNLYQVEGGTVNIPLAFYNSLTSEYPKEYKDIPYPALGEFTWRPGNWVIGIYESDVKGKVILRYTNNFSRIGVDESFDYVICTAPLSEIRAVDIKPRFRERKMEAIREINYLNAQKTLFLCKEPFWERGDESEKIVGGISNTDLLIESIVYPSYGSHGSLLSSQSQIDPYHFSRPSVFIASYNLSLDATRLVSVNEEERVALIKRQVEEVHGLPVGYLNTMVMGAKTVNWVSEFGFSGAFTRFYPGQGKEFFYELSIPEYDNRVFFAGEHTSTNHAWMQGALYSGKLAANKVAYYHRQRNSYSSRNELHCDRHNKFI